MKFAFETTFALLTCNFAIAVGTSVLIKKTASTHALTELLILVMFVSLRYIDLPSKEVPPSTGEDTRPLSTWVIQSMNEDRGSMIRTAVEMSVNFVLLIMLGLEVFGISIPDSRKANLVLATLNILYALGTYVAISFWYVRFTRFPYQGAAAMDSEPLMDVSYSWD